MIQDPDLREQLAPVARTVDTVVPESELKERLASGRPLRCKLGLDVTSPSVHIGNGIQLWNLRRLQDMGHTAVLILGDYTTLVGDPSGKDKTRPMLSEADIERNIATWEAQLAVVLDMERAELRRNSDWFAPMTFREVLELTSRMTVQQMMERDSFAKRWQSQNPISVREFIYCLMQGWDSVVVKADIELGGTDQTFNLMVGRRLMEQVGLPPQVALIGPLLEGTDGQEKMSKSLNNAIGLTDAPKEQFGRAMRISDELLPKYLRMATDLPDARIDELLALENPMEAKLAMAQALVARYHGVQAGAEQHAEFLRVFRDHATPADVPSVALPVPGEDGTWWIVDVLKACGFAKTTGDARRLVEGGGVRLNEVVISDWRDRLSLAGGEILRVGRRRYAELTR